MVNDMFSSLTFPSCLNSGKGSSGRFVLNLYETNKSKRINYYCIKVAKKETRIDGFVIFRFIRPMVFVPYSYHADSFSS
jgi:hypothetical protein